jgi:hypothetical protein
MKNIRLILKIILSLPFLLYCLIFNVLTLCVFLCFSTIFGSLYFIRLLNNDEEGADEIYEICIMLIAGGINRYIVETFDSDKNEEE